MVIIERDALQIFQRVYTPPIKKKERTNKVFKQWSEDSMKGFENIFVFDTETQTDTKQELRVGYYEQYASGELIARGFFGPADAANSVQRIHGTDSFESTKSFRKRLAGFAYQSSSLVIGFNLPFDISRIAESWSPARGNYDGGFSFTLTGGTSIRVKHIAKHKALLQFSGKGVRAKFCDVSTIAKALFSRGFSLGQLGDYLSVGNKKTTTDYNGPISREYLEYLVNDVKCTYECFQRLSKKWDTYSLHKTGIHQVISEASIGKAALKEMGVKSFLACNSWEPELIGTVMGTYYGGRSEIHLRRKVADVMCLDFLSMYPTVCSLMDLWKYVIADSISYCDCTSEVRRRILSYSCDSVLDVNVWKNMGTICQVKPNEDILPIRAKYNGVSTNVGVNYVSSRTPIWYTLADCLASKLLTGKSPEILQAISFYPQRQQSGLKPLDILGNKQYNVDPYNTDFYRRLIELRTTTKGDDKLAIKIIANATCYGIFIELIPSNIKEQSVEYYNDEKHHITLSKEEKSGAYFNPLLATLITGAARLMLAATETVAKQQKLDWVLCDTDSMFLTGEKSENSITHRSLVRRTNRVSAFFQKLNPYQVDVPVLKNENPNGKPLKCFAISAKRYVVFDQDGNIHKASSHGLGHLSSPYGVKHTDSGAPEWVNNMWHGLIFNSNGHVHLLRKPAMAQFTASTPRLAKKIPPFSFVSVFQLASDYPGIRVTPIAPYGISPVEVSKLAFNPDTLNPIPPCYLKTYAEILATYPYHNESKFDGGDDEGWTDRRHVVITGIGFIGKEGNKLDEQEVGLATAEILEYGVDTKHAIEVLKEYSEIWSYQDIANWLHISRAEVSFICHDKRKPSKKLINLIEFMVQTEVLPIHGPGHCSRSKVKEWEVKNGKLVGDGRRSCGPG